MSTKFPKNLHEMYFSSRIPLFLLFFELAPRTYSLNAVRWPLFLNIFRKIKKAINIYPPTNAIIYVVNGRQRPGPYALMHLFALKNTE